jgi:hypothetical protein
MKVLIYQVYVPTDGKGNPIEAPNPKLVNASVESFTKYAAKYEMDYLFENRPTFTESELPEDRDSRMRFYWSMALCRDELMKYDYVIHVDTDIIAQGHAKDIRPHLKGDFCAVRELLDYLGHWHNPINPLRRAFAYHGKAYHYGYDQYQYFNSGVWVSSPKSRQLIREKWKQSAFKKWKQTAPDNFPFKEDNPFAGDQDILNAIVHTSDLEFYPLSWNWNGLSDGIKEVKKADFIHYCAKVGKLLFNFPEYLKKAPLSLTAIKELEERPTREMEFVRR